MKRILINIFFGFSLCFFLLTGCSEETDKNPAKPTTAAEATEEAKRPTADTGNPTARPEQPTPTAETPAPTDGPDREIVAAAPKRTIFCGYRYFSALQEDGTVAALGELTEEEQERLNGWKEIAALCNYGHSPSALRKDGSIAVAEADSFAEELEKLLASGAGTETGAAATLRYLSTAKAVIWADLNYPTKCIAIDRDGTLFETTEKGETLVTKGTAAVQTAGELFLDCYGNLHPVNGSGKQRYEEGKMAEWGPCVCIAYSARSGNYYAVRADGTLCSTAILLETQEWIGLTSVFVGGGTIVGLRKDGTVVARRELEGGKYGQCEVEEWRNVVEIVTNGYYTVGKTADGALLCTEIPPEADVPFGREDVEGILRH